MKNPPKLTKKEQECFDHIKYNGMLIDCDWNKRSVIVHGEVYRKRDRYGRWHDAYYQFPKSLVDRLIQKGYVVQITERAYQAKAVFEERLARKQLSETERAFYERQQQRRERTKDIEARTDEFFEKLKRRYAEENEP